MSSTCHLKLAFAAANAATTSAVTETRLILQLPLSPAMIIDAGKNYRNSARAGRHSGQQRRVPVGGITWRHTFRALRYRNYRLFFWGQLVSLSGTWMQQTAMSWFVYQITNSKLLLGLVAAVGSAPMVLSSVWGGALADLYPKRSILVATQSAQMVCAFVLAAGVWLGFASPLFIIIVAALNGIAMGFDMPARQAFRSK